MKLNTGTWPIRYTTMYFVSLALLVASLPLSKFTMSLFQFSTLFFWLWHGVDTSFLKNYPSASLLNPLKLFKFLGMVVKLTFQALIRKFIEFFRNKPAMALASLFLLHIAGLLYTTDFNYALKDLRTKVPLFILPLFIATGPRLSTRTFYLILACFIGAVLGGSIYRLILYMNLPMADSRSLSAHTSHIRFSLNAVYATFIALFFISSKGLLNTWHKWLLIVFSIWIIGFITYMSYTTGIILFVLLGLLLLIYKSLKIKVLWLKLAALSGIAILILIPLLLLVYTGYKSVSTPAVEFSKLEKYTISGNTYYHDTVNFKSRNGKWIGLYISDKELRQSWAQRSSIPIDGFDKKKQLIRFTLITYLASKDLRKDAEGMSKLSDAEIRNIENGINSFKKPQMTGFKSQFADFITGYQRYIQYNDPNSGSMIQRFEYWRTSLLIIQQHPVIGVGTGDLPSAFQNQYEKMTTNLSMQNRLRSHNQYLSITVAFGIIGLIWFIAVMILPGIITRNFKNYFYLVFWIIFMLSMLTEDTIETQEGVTFYILFTALMLLGREKAEPSEDLFLTKN